MQQFQSDNKIVAPVVLSKNREIKSSRLFLDSLFVLLLLSTSYSILPYLIFGQFSRFANMIALLIFTFAYMGWRFKFHILIPKKDTPFIIYFILNAFNCFSAAATDTGWQAALVYLFVNTVFYIFLYNLYQDYRKYCDFQRSIRNIVRGYLWLIVICLISCTTIFILVKLGFNPKVNAVNTRYDLFYDNFTNLDSNYFMPHNISIFNIASDIRLPFFQEQGFALGIYHEPHILTFMTFPALFIMLYYAYSAKRKVLIISTFMLVLLLASSTTNIMAVLICIITYLGFLAITINSKNSLKNIGIILSAIIFGLFIYLYTDTKSILFIINKLGSGSMSYSVSTLDFALAPKTLLGSSYLKNDYLKIISTNGRDVGYINFILNALFLLVCAYYMIKIFFRKGRFHLMYCLAFIYFFAHSTKVAMVAYSLSMLMFIIFIMTRIYQEGGGKREPLNES